MMIEIVVMNIEMGHYPTETRLCWRLVIRLSVPAGRKAVWEDGESAKRCLRLDCRRVTVFSSLHGDDGANLRTRAGQSH